MSDDMKIGALPPGAENMLVKNPDLVKSYTDDPNKQPPDLIDGVKMGGSGNDDVKRLLAEAENTSVKGVSQGKEADAKGAAKRGAMNSAMQSGGTILASILTGAKASKTKAAEEVKKVAKTGKEVGEVIDMAAAVEPAIQEIAETTLAEIDENITAADEAKEKQAAAEEQAKATAEAIESIKVEIETEEDEGIKEEKMGTAEKLQGDLEGFTGESEAIGAEIEAIVAPLSGDMGAGLAAQQEEIGRLEGKVVEQQEKCITQTIASGMTAAAGAGIMAIGIPTSATLTITSTTGEVLGKALNVTGKSLQVGAKPLLAGIYTVPAGAVMEGAGIATDASGLATSVTAQLTMNLGQKIAKNTFESGPMLIVSGASTAVGAGLNGALSAVNNGKLQENKEEFTVKQEQIQAKSLEGLDKLLI